MGKMMIELTTRVRILMRVVTTMMTKMEEMETMRRRRRVCLKNTWGQCAVSPCGCEMAYGGVRRRNSTSRDHDVT